MLREYQQRAIHQLYEWFNSHPIGNPCLVLPTGSGKSHIVAALCKDAVKSWPGTKVLMMSHVAELIEQNAEKMLQHTRRLGSIRLALAAVILARQLRLVAFSHYGRRAIL